MIKPGLVYGPPEESVKKTIFSFCIVAVFGFFIETIQNVDDLLVKKKLPFLSQPLTNFILIVFEDIPLLILNLIITVCRDGEPTLISVIKASVCIGVVVIRVTLMVIYHWFIDVKKNRFDLVMDALSTVGLVVIGALSISIQLLNNFPTNPYGYIQAVDPVTFNRMHYVTNKYLKDVGIYATWPLDSNETTNYIYLADITDVMSQTYLSFEINTNFDKSAKSYNVCFAKTKIKQETCFQINNSTYSTLLNATSKDLFNNQAIKYKLEITKEPALNMIYLIGYIDYNLNRLSFNDSNCEQKSINSMIYAKFLPYFQTTNLTYLRDNNQLGYSFYNLKTDLVTVDHLWKTGVVGCEMAGDLGPKFNKEIHLVC